MTCQQYQQWLVPCLHDQLEPGHQNELATHLTGCAGCAHELEEYRELEEMLRSVTKITPPHPEDTVAAVNAKIDAWESRQTQQARPNHLVRYGMAVAAAAILIVVVSRPLFVRQIARTEQATEAQRMRWDTQTQPALRLQWTVADQREATTALSEWLTQTQGARLVFTEQRPWRSHLSRDNTGSDVPTMTDMDRLIVQLPVSSYPALLAELAKHGQLSSQPPAPEAVSADQPLTVELSLVVQAP